MLDILVVHLGMRTRSHVQEYPLYPLAVELASPLGVKLSAIFHHYIPYKTHYTVLKMFII